MIVDVRCLFREHEALKINFPALMGQGVVELILDMGMLCAM